MTDLPATMWIVRLDHEINGSIYIGPFATAEAAEAWLDAMPDDEDLEDAVVEAMAPPTLPNGEPNY